MSQRGTGAGKGAVAMEIGGGPAGGGGGGTDRLTLERMKDMLFTTLDRDYGIQKRRANLVRAFRAMDVNRSANLSRQEFDRSLTRLGVSIPIGPRRTLFTFLDQDGDQLVSYDDLNRFLFSALPGDPGAGGDEGAGVAELAVTARTLQQRRVVGHMGRQLQRMLVAKDLAPRMIDALRGLEGAALKVKRAEFEAMMRVLNHDLVPPLSQEATAWLARTFGCMGGGDVRGGVPEEDTDTGEPMVDAQALVNFAMGATDPWVETAPLEDLLASTAVSEAYGPKRQRAKARTNEEPYQRPSAASWGEWEGRNSGPRRLAARGRVPSSVRAPSNLRDFDGGALGAHSPTHGERGAMRASVRFDDEIAAEDDATRRAAMHGRRTSHPPPRPPDAADLAAGRLVGGEEGGHRSWRDLSPVSPLAGVRVASPQGSPAGSGRPLKAWRWEEEVLRNGDDNGGTDARRTGGRRGPDPDPSHGEDEWWAARGVPSRVGLAGPTDPDTALGSEDWLEASHIREKRRSDPRDSEGQEEYVTEQDLARMMQRRNELEPSPTRPRGGRMRGRGSSRKGARADQSVTLPSGGYDSTRVPAAEVKGVHRTLQRVYRSLQAPNEAPRPATRRFFDFCDKDGDGLLSNEDLTLVVMDATAAAADPRERSGRVGMGAPPLAVLDAFVETVKAVAGRSIESVPHGLVFGEVLRWLQPLPPAIATIREKLVRTLQIRMREAIGANSTLTVRDAHALSADAAANLLRSALRGNATRDEPLEHHAMVSRVVSRAGYMRALRRLQLPLAAHDAAALAAYLAGKDRDNGERPAQPVDFDEFVRFCTL